MKQKAPGPKIESLTISKPKNPKSPSLKQSSSKNRRASSITQDSTLISRRSTFFVIQELEEEQSNTVVSAVSSTDELSLNSDSVMTSTSSFEDLL